MKSNMYDFVDIRWNPVKGKCLFNCSYCYVGRWGNVQKPVHIDDKEMRLNLGTGNFIFVCSGTDLFHPSVPWDMIVEVFAAAHKYPENTYLWHTKNPQRAIEDIPSCLRNPKSVLCVTVETDVYIEDISTAPAPIDRLTALKEWKGKKMITIEPIMDFNLDVFVQMIVEANPVQVNIGADSGRNGLPEPSSEKIGNLIEALRPHTKIHLKNNLSRIFKG